MLRALLRLGNHMNAETAKGGAVGVTLGSLDRFCTAKGLGGTTLIDCLATILDKKGSARHLDFVDGLPSLTDAARYVDDDHTAGAARTLRRRLGHLQRCLGPLAAGLAPADRKRAKKLRGATSHRVGSRGESCRDAGRAPRPQLGGRLEDVCHGA